MEPKLLPFELDKEWKGHTLGFRVWEDKYWNCNIVSIFASEKKYRVRSLEDLKGWNMISWSTVHGNDSALCKKRDATSVIFIADVDLYAYLPCFSLHNPNEIIKAGLLVHFTTTHIRNLMVRQSLHLWNWRIQERCRQFVVLLESLWLPWGAKTNVSWFYITPREESASVLALWVQLMMIQLQCPNKGRQDNHLICFVSEFNTFISCFRTYFFSGYWFFCFLWLIVGLWSFRGVTWARGWFKAKVYAPVLK